MAFRELVLQTLNSVNPFVSEEDVDKGARWTPTLQRQLESSSDGVVCTTPDNLDAPWLTFEAGALSKVTDSALFVLLFGLPKSDLALHPLGQFQMTDGAVKADVLKLFRSLNKRLAVQVEERIWLPRFEERWPIFDASVKKYAELHAEELRKRLASARVQLKPDETTRARLPKDTQNRAILIKQVPRILRQMGYKSVSTEATAEGSEPLVFTIDESMDRDLIEHLSGIISELLGLLDGRDEYPVYVLPPNGRTQRIHWDPTKT